MWRWRAVDRPPHVPKPSFLSPLLSYPPATPARYPRPAPSASLRRNTRCRCTSGSRGRESRRSSASVWPTMAVLPEQCGPGRRTFSDSQSSVSRGLGVQRQRRPDSCRGRKSAAPTRGTAGSFAGTRCGAAGISSGRSVAVRLQRGAAAEQQPIDVQLRLAVVDVQHHLIVVAQQGHESALLPQRAAAARSRRGCPGRGRCSRPGAPAYRRARGRMAASSVSSAGRQPWMSPMAMVRGCRPSVRSSISDQIHYNVRHGVA